jgi:hypothetical protein
MGELEGVREEARIVECLCLAVEGESVPDNVTSLNGLFKRFDISLGGAVYVKVLWAVQVEGDEVGVGKEREGLALTEVTETLSYFNGIGEMGVEVEVNDSLVSGKRSMGIETYV